LLCIFYTDTLRGNAMKMKVLLAGLIGVFLVIQILGAQPWDATKRLSKTSGGSWVPVIAADTSGNLHVAWHDYTPGNNEIYYVKSTDIGLTWGAVKRITWNSGASRSPAIAVDSSDNLHVVWSDETPGNREILYKSSTNGGESWGSSKRLTWNSEWSVSPELSVDSSDHIHVVWRDDTPGNSEIYYKKSTNGGVSWGSSKRLTWNSGYSILPAMALGSSNNIHVTWYDESPGIPQIFYRRSTNSGSSWDGTKRITWSSGGSIDPKIAVNTSIIHLAWAGGTSSDAEIFFRRSTNSGSSWDGTRRLTWNIENSMYPAVAADSSNRIHVVWEDRSNDNNWEIYYKKSTDGGSSWTAKRLTWNSGWSSYVNIIVDSSNDIHVVWNDDTPGNYEIYYKKGNQ
jgi:hypothetical protein